MKVPPEHHAPFIAALPEDPRIEVQKMFGGLAAKVNGNLFAGLFGRSVMLNLDAPDKAEALALPGAGPFDPMGDGRVMSQKVMMPPAMMHEPKTLSAWIARAFASAAARPEKAPKAKATKRVARAEKASSSPAKTKSVSTTVLTAKKSASAVRAAGAVTKRRGAR